MPETTQQNAVTVAEAAKEFGAAVGKDIAYEAVVHVTAVAIILGTLYGVSKLAERRKRKKVTPVASVVTE